MRVMLAGGGRCHLSYCTNIHPGEAWDEVMRALEHHTLPIADRLRAPDEAFGIGLRLSNAAVSELEDTTRLHALQRWLSDHRLYVFTINGFPYGAFHDTRVKHAVYRPDWRSEQRVQYTLRLARVLAALSPEGAHGSISTVPGGFRDDIVTDEARELVARRLLDTAIALHRLHSETGRVISVAIEPEPHCQLETLSETAGFFTTFLRSRSALGYVMNALGVTAETAADVLRTHLGVCLDTCHAAVEYESITEALRQLRAADVQVKKMQLSNALTIVDVTLSAVERLRAFADDVYLHQVVERRVDRAELTRYVDLPDALAAFAREPNVRRQWRVHFHIPLYAEPLAPLSSTADVLRAAIDEQRRAPFTDHVEVETYTWQVLPAALRDGDVNESITRELRFTLDALRGAAS